MSEPITCFSMVNWTQNEPLIDCIFMVSKVMCNVRIVYDSARTVELLSMSK